MSGVHPNFEEQRFFWRQKVLVAGFIFLLTHKSQDRSIILRLKIYSVNSTTFIIMAAPDGGEGVIMFVYLGGEQEAPFDVTLMSSSLDPSKLFLRGHSTDVDRWCLWKRIWRRES